MKCFRSLRDFLEFLDEEGELARITTEVDKDWEISTISRKVWLEYKHDERPALLFENVKGHPGMSVCVGAYASHRRAAMSLGILADGPRQRWELMRDRFVDSFDKRMEPIVVKTAPCKENIILGKDVDLLRLPIPLWTPGKDAGPYITSGGTVSKDPETGERNIGVYRLQVKGKDTLGIFAGEGQDNYYHRQKAWSKNRPLEVAVIIGSSSPVFFASFHKVPYDEFTVAGGLLQEPLEVVKCETVDLEVPATSEIVIEGEIPPNYVEEEGPFGEAFGVMSPKRLQPIIKVKAITYRNNPIYHGFVTGSNPDTASSTKEAIKPFWVYNALRLAGVPGVKDIYTPEIAAGQFINIISIKKMWKFHPKHVMYAIWGSKSNYESKFIVVTDESLDIRNPAMLARAIFMNVEPARDVTIIEEGGGSLIDPAVGANTEQRSSTSSKIGIDATGPYEYDSTIQDQKYFDQVAERWDGYHIKPLSEMVKSVVRG